MGPFRVVRQITHVSYELELPRYWQIHDEFHVVLLKPYRDDGQVHPVPVRTKCTYLAGQPCEYEVDFILDHHPKQVNI